MLPLCLLVSKASKEKSAAHLMEAPSYVTSHSSLTAVKSPSDFGFWQFDYNMSWCGFLLVCPMWSLLRFWIYGFMSFIKFGGPGLFVIASNIRLPRSLPGTPRPAFLLFLHPTASCSSILLHSLVSTPHGVMSTPLSSRPQVFSLHRQIRCGISLVTSAFQPLYCPAPNFPSGSFQ